MMAFAILGALLGFGCENRTNESASEKIDVPANAPKTQADYYKQTQEQVKQVKKVKKTSR